VQVVLKLLYSVQCNGRQPALVRQHDHCALLPSILLRTWAACAHFNHAPEALQLLPMQGMATRPKWCLSMQHDEVEPPQKPPLMKSSYVQLQELRCCALTNAAL
jgi:hypothetical protein